MENKKRRISRRQFLKEAGLATLSGTTLVGIAGKTVAGTLPAARKVPVQYFMTNPMGYSAPMWELVTLAIENWKKLGVTFKREVLDHDELNSKGLFGGKFDVRIQYFSGIPARLDPDFMLTLRFFATCEHFYPRIPAAECPGGGGSFNSMGYYKPEFNSLMEEQKKAYDYEERKKIIDKAIEMTVRDRPALVLFAPHMLHLMNTKNWEGEKPMVGEGLSAFWNVIGIKPKGRDKTLKVGSIYTVPNINPLATMTAQGYRACRLIYDRLLRIDITGKPIKWMAEEVTATDGPSGPKTAIAIKIRNDLKFHDNVPVTADDVKFTFDFAKKWKAPDLMTYLKHVASVEKVGKYAVKLNLDAPWSAMYHVLLSRILILPKHIWEKVPDQVGNPVEWANPEPIGSGPFKFESWERAAQMVLTKSKDYFYPVEPERIVRVRFETTEMLGAAIERAEIDIQWGEPMQPEIALRAEKVKNVKLIKAPNHGHMVFDLRIDKRPYTDPAFRKALDYCLPRRQMIDQIYQGFADRAVSTLPPGNKAWHNRKVFDLAVDYNPEKGRQTLKEAGYEWDAEGNLYYPA